VRPVNAASSRKRSRKPRQAKARASGQPASAPQQTRIVAVGLLVLLAAGASALLWQHHSQANAPAPAAVPPPPRAAEPAVAPPESPEPARLRVRVHARYPHDPEAFTQGLVWDRGRLFESAGRVGHSSLREVELGSGARLRTQNNAPELFAEGLALLDGELYQLTWRDQRALVWDARSFQLLREIPYQGEGWGLCHDGQRLVMSDGSAFLYYRNRESFAVERELLVTRNGLPQRALNELECAAGKIYANVWQTDEIVRIDPGDGHVEAVIDASSLLPERQGADVLNGIAYRPDNGHFLLTGKLWPTLFEVSFEPAR
jgi:glutaminyl-peptide cyclotransferase